MKRTWCAAGMMALLATLAGAAPLVAQDRVPGAAIRDRIKSRMELRRSVRIPPLGTATRLPGGGPGYESVLIQGQARTFLRYTPNSVLVAARRVPVVFALHGARGTADRLQGYLGLNAVADREGFIVVYPQGLENIWNDGRKAKVKVKGAKPAGDVDDVAFLNGLADALVAQGIADPARLYLTGISNGGFMTLRLACEGTTRFAAFATVIASLPLTARSTCKPARPLPLVMINGTSDSLVRYDGGAGRLGISGNAAPLEAAAFMAGLNGCASVTDIAMPARDAADPTSVTRRVWNGCKPGGGVEFYTVKGGGHQAPVIGAASSGVVLEMFLGTRSHQIDTAETMWDFFKRAGQ